MDGLRDLGTAGVDAHQELGALEATEGQLCSLPGLAWPQEPPHGEEGMEEKHMAPQRPPRSQQEYTGGEDKRQDTLLETTRPPACSRGPLAP